MYKFTHHNRRFYLECPTATLYSALGVILIISYYWWYTLLMTSAFWYFSIREYLFLLKGTATLALSATPRITLVRFDLNFFSYSCSSASIDRKSIHAGFIGFFVSYRFCRVSSSSETCLLLGLSDEWHIRARRARIAIIGCVSSSAKREREREREREVTINGKNN